MENEEKQSNSKKEVLMIIVVVVLAFGLTVAGIVYLAGFLMGSTKPDKTEESAPIPKPVEDDILRFTMDNDAAEQDNGSATMAEQPVVPPPVAVTPPPAPPAPPAGHHWFVPRGAARAGR
jgi:hypothetical protein